MANFPKKRPPRPTRASRPREDDLDDAPPEQAPRRERVRAPSADQLLEMADDLEEQGRALIAQAKQLQRIAEGLERGGQERGAPERGGQDRPAPSRGPRPGGRAGPPRRGPGGPRTGPGRGAPARGGQGRAGGGRDEERDERKERPRRSPPRGDAPDWAPTPRKRRP